MVKSSSETPVRYFKEQFDDEEVLLVFRKHALVMRKGMVIAAIGLLLPMLYVMALTFIYTNTPEKLPTVNFFYACMGVGLLLAVIIMFPFWISWWYSIYIVTNQRLIQITQRGLFHRSMVALNLDQIQMVNYEISGVEQSLLGSGTIMVQTYVGSLTIHHVHHPGEIQKSILHILRDQGIRTQRSPADIGQIQSEEEE